MKREFNVVIERDSEGFSVASVPQIHGCHPQARSLHKLLVASRRPSSSASELETQGSQRPSSLACSGSQWRYEPAAAVVPVHAGEVLGPGLFNQILKDAEISRDDFAEYLGRWRSILDRLIPSD